MKLNQYSPGPSQEEVVLRHLNTVGTISALEASGLHNIRSLSRRITELKRRGHVITAATKRDVNGQRYVRYSLVRE